MRFLSCLRNVLLLRCDGKFTIIGKLCKLPVNAFEESNTASGNELLLQVPTNGVNLAYTACNKDLILPAFEKGTISLHLHAFSLHLLAFACIWICLHLLAFGRICLILLAFEKGNICLH